MSLNHGGNPAPPNNPGIDGTSLTLGGPGGADSWVIPVTDNFNVSLEFTLSGTIASGLVGYGLAYYVQYAFSGLGGGPNTVLNVPNATVANQLIYGDPDTTATVTAGTLPVGTYELVATVTIPIIQAAAFVELPVVDIFQP
jgi:hypothetical protein